MKTRRILLSLMAISFALTVSLAGCKKGADHPKGESKEHPKTETHDHSDHSGHDHEHPSGDK